MDPRRDSCSLRLPSPDALARSLSAPVADEKKPQVLPRLSYTPPFERQTQSLSRYRVIPSIPPRENSYPAPQHLNPTLTYQFSYPFIPVLPWHHQDDVHGPRNAPHFTTQMPQRYIRPRVTFFKRELSRRQAALIIQKHYRGHRVRRNIRYIIFLAKKRAAYELVNEMIDAFLSHEAIPTLLIEVLTERKSHGGLDPEDPLVLTAELVCEDYLCEGVVMILPDVVSLAMDDMIREYMAVEGDPSNGVYEILCGEYIGDVSGEIVREVIDEEIGEYFLETRAEIGLDIILEGLVEVVLESVLAEGLAENLYDKIFDCVAGPAISSIAEEVSAECTLESVSQFAGGKMLDELILDHMLKSVGDNGDGIVFRQFSERLIDSTMLSCLLQRDYNMSIEGTGNNLVLEEMHSELFAESAVDVILEKLVAHMDIDQEEEELGY